MTRIKKRQSKRRIRHSQMLARRKWLWSLTGLLLAIFIMLSISPDSPHSLDNIATRGHLRVITRNAPTTYYESRDGLAGLEYEMAQSFAQFLGVKAEFIVKDSVNDVITDLHSSRGDLAAAGLSLTRERPHGFLFGPAYQKIQQQVVCLRSAKLPKNILELQKLNLTVVANSSSEAQLNAMQRQYPKWRWQVTYEMDAEQLLEQVAKAKLHCTVVDSNVMSVNRRYYPELVIAFNLTKHERLSWAMPADAEELHYVLQLWFENFLESGKLAKLKQKYYGHIDFDYVDTRIFTERIASDLPKFKSLFIQAEKKYAISWTLLASMAYQESHWKVNAQSPTGVRGIMMLTQVTARELGVKNRLDPRQSILGGAQYLSALHKRLPKEIVEPDRTWFALAAYNVGLGHIQDAMKLARRQRRNPYVWSDLAQVLPLLTQKKHFSTLKHGYARGREPVIFVSNIRDYKDILERHAYTRHLGGTFDRISLAYCQKMFANAYL